MKCVEYVIVVLTCKSSFQVSQNGLDIVGLLVERLCHGFKVYVNTVIGAVVDRLGDTREVVRERANHVLTRSEV